MRDSVLLVRDRCYVLHYLLIIDEWRNECIDELIRLYDSVLNGDEKKATLDEKIKEYGVKGVPALMNVRYFNIFLDILLVY